MAQMGRRWATTMVSLAASYLVGAFPTADLVNRAVGHDVHHEGSGNPGATNTYRLAGAPAAAIVMAVDMGKGAVASWAGDRLDGRGPACGVAAVLGHCFPPTDPGAGGKGVATAGGMLLVTDPPLAVLAAATWAGLAKATRRASLASIVAAAALPIAATALRRPAKERRALLATAAVIVLRHRENIGRLRRGVEPALGSTSPPDG